MNIELTEPDILDGLEKTMKEFCMERDEAVMAMLREGMAHCGMLDVDDLEEDSETAGEA